MFRHCTVLALLLALGTTAAARQAAVPAPATGTAAFDVFVRGTLAGTIRTSVARSGTTWIVSSSGTIGDLALSRFEARYSDDWQPTTLLIEATKADKPLGLSTSFTVTTAINEITQNGITNSKTDQVSARTVVLPNTFFGAYEALAPRLAASDAGAVIPVYVAPQTEIKVHVTGISEQTLSSPEGTIRTRAFALTFDNPGGALDATVTIDARARFAKLEIPSAGILVVRQDVAGVGTRTESFRNPTDVEVTIPASGFVLAGTLTMPPGEGRLRHPVVVLVNGAGGLDRDGTVAGIPVFGQLAGALANQGFMVVRYDKRGIGQSGGRTETATLQDYADDAIAVVRWLSDRKDVDTRRVTIAGHSDGGAVAMLAAAQEKKIDALVLIDTPGTTGAELVLERQQHALDLIKASPEDRAAKMALQMRIHDAILKGTPWDDVPDEMHQSADTPWFRSILAFDPARVMPRIHQPILIVQGDLDTQVPPHHADRLASLARARKKAPDTQVVHLPRANHILVAATTGEEDEYASLPDKHVVADAPTMIVNWLKGLP